MVTYRIHGTVHALILLLVAVGAAELTARVDDWWFRKIPFWSAPSSADLFMTDASGQRRGRPEASYQKWHLNAYGFRSAEMSQVPRPDTKRVVLLGASETFGLYESPGKEFAGQLAALVGPYHMEIVNAAVPGITVSTMQRYWDSWVARFGASTVIIYPSVHLYLSCEDWPADGAAGDTGTSSQARFDFEDLRLFGRIKNVVSQPDFLVRWRNARKVQATASQHPASWVYDAPPAVCLSRFKSDLLRLVDDVRSTGAEVIVCTQALRAASDPGEDDLRDLESFRVFSPRAPARVMREFVSQANQAIRELPEQRDVRVVDIDSLVGGRRADFEDLVHFNDRGSALVAEALRGALVAASAPQRNKS